MAKKQTKVSNDLDIKIIVACHKDCQIPRSDLLLPVQVGSALSSKKLNIQSDDTGDNISYKNESYCELTAIYWAWKNLDLDYYGLFHYRRYLSFNPDQHADSEHAVVCPDVSAAESKAWIDSKKMREVISDYDVIVPRKNHVKNFSKYSSIYDHYKNEHYISDLDFCLEYIDKKYPELIPFKDTVHKKDGYFCNMFIMKKALYNEYCEFLFDVIDNFEKNNDISEYSPYQHRVSGFLAERLTNLFIQYLQSLQVYKIKELQTAFIENTDNKSELRPLNGADDIAVVLAANNFYVPYISTLLHSVAQNSSNDNFYDINIFHHDITDQNKKVLTNEFSNYSNINIRFYDISSRRSEYKGLFTRGHFALETYFRLFIQDIMTDYEKVLYLDGDMIVKSDVADLFNTSIHGYVLAAALDPDTAGLYNGYEKNKKVYMDTILKIEKPYSYFQAGVILFNLKEMRKRYKVSNLISYAASYNWQLLDQDVLNNIAQGHVKHIDMAWNVMYDWRGIRLKKIISKAPINLYKEYVKARSNPKIIHYAGPEKPWNYPECDFGLDYWNIAKKSIYYEVIVSRMIDARSKQGDTKVYNRMMYELGIKTKIIRRIKKVFKLFGNKKKSKIVT